MRTKTNEKKRYSLRTPRKMIHFENIGSEKVKLETTGSNRKETETAVMSPVQTVKKTKRKGKPVKSATREEMEGFQQNTTPQKVKNNPTVFQEMISISSNTAHSTPVVPVKNLQLPPPQPSQPLEEVKVKVKGTSTTTVTANKKHYPPPSSSPVIEFRQKMSTVLAPVAATNNVVDNTPYESSSSAAKDVPVYTALEHAIHCRLDKSCPFQKCSIAKQFLLHFSSCSLKKDDCTICKAMDIMVCKHAEECERSLDKCCPIPNCDYVRKLMMGEWLKFRNNHHEIVTRAFNGLIHARKCRDPNCDSVLCKNIKSVLLHTQTCSKKEDCKTRKFVVQLCEYHQDTCENESCFVEFCVENRRMRSEENARKQLEQQLLREKQEQFMHAHQNTKPVSNLNFNNIFFPNGLQGYINLQHMLNAASQPSVLMLGQQPSAYPAYPTVSSLPLPSTIPPPLPPVTLTSTPLTHQSHKAAESLTSSKDLRQQHQFHQQWNAHQDQFFNNYGKQHEQYNHSQWPLHPHQYTSTNSLNNTPMEVCDVSEPHKLATEEGFPSTNGKKDSMVASYPVPQQKRARFEGGNICTSPTPDMYYQFFPMKMDQKEQLPRLSPNELQSILTRGIESSVPVLSPVHDNRAQFSEPPFLLNEFQQNSQESELEENPIGDDGGRDFRCLVTATPTDEENVDKISEMMKEQEEWGKIDFVKEQHLQQGYDIETETADETESENNNIFDKSSMEQRQEREPDSCYFVKSDIGITNGDQQVSLESGEEIHPQSSAASMTSLERNFLTILQSRQRDEVLN